MQVILPEDPLIGGKEKAVPLLVGAIRLQGKEVGAWEDVGKGGKSYSKSSKLRNFLHLNNESNSATTQLPNILNENLLPGKTRGFPSG